MEGFTEYLALQAGRDLLGDTFYKVRLQRYASTTKNKEGFKRLSQIEKGSEIGEMFRYNFTPLLLTALEQKVGREALWSFLREALSHKNPFTDYAFLIASLTKAGIDLATFETIERDLLETPEGINKVLKAFE